MGESDSGKIPTPSLLIVCEHAEPCGGCPLIGLPYGDQLAQKQGRLMEAVGRYAGLEGVEVAATAPAEPVIEYRTRAKLIVGPGPRIGLYGRGGGHLLVDIPGCRVLSPPIAAVVRTLRERIAREEATGGLLGAFGAEGGALRALDLRDVTTTGEGGKTVSRVMVTLVMQRGRVKDPSILKPAAEALLTEQPLIASVAASMHDGDGPQILGAELIVLAGPGQTEDRVGLSTHFASHGAFVQAHRGQAARIHELLRALVVPGKDTRILDLYGGAGAIALSLAEAGARVHLVESFAPAVEQARAAAAAQKLAVTAEVADTAAALRELVRKREKFDAVVVNPPRRGMTPAARELVAVLAPTTLAYVSCDPDTLARDLDHFGRLGYRASTLHPIDMIPLTDEVETVVILERGLSTLPRVVHEEVDLLVVEKSAHEPTVPQGEYLSSLMTRVRLIPGAERATPIYRLDVGTSGLVLFVRHPEELDPWTKMMTGTSCRRVYLAAVRGVPPMKGAVTRDLREGGVRYAARTRYRRLSTFAGHGLVRAVPEVGRTHQVRRHLAAVGHPVLGDDRYGHGPTNRYFEERHTLDRTFLHCVRLELMHPTTDARLVIESPLPGDLRTVLTRLGGPDTLAALEQKNALGGFGGMTSIPPPPSSESEPQIDLGPLDVDASTPTVRPEPSDAPAESLRGFSLRIINPPIIDDPDK